MTTDADVLAAVNVAAFPDGQAVNQQAVFGNSIEFDDGGSIVGARAMFQGYGLAADPDDDAEINEEVFEWNGEFQVTKQTATWTLAQRQAGGLVGLMLSPAILVVQQYERVPACVGPRSTQGQKPASYLGHRRTK